MELYVHIPFCVQKCNYCDFLSAPAEEATRQEYVKALSAEISYYGRERRLRRCRELSEPVSSVYFGGGTPSVLGAERLGALLSLIREEFPPENDAEITVEVNPATIDLAGLGILKESGVNRLSIGVQSADDENLRLLGRVHTFADARKTVENARKVEIRNLNLDLISGIPGQDLQKFRTDLEAVIGLEPEHISVYSLMLEEGTPFHKHYVNHKDLLPSEEEDRKMYRLTQEMLRNAGYLRYEISNYAKPGYASKHNSGYWKRVPYLGVGLGASSFLGRTRFRGKSVLQDYMQFWLAVGSGGQKTQAVFADVPTDAHPAVFAEASVDGMPGALAAAEEVELLSKKDEMAEYLFLGLRMSEGVSIDGFYRLFGSRMEEIYPKELERLQGEGLLVMDRERDRLYLTEFGVDVSNYVFEKFV